MKKISLLLSLGLLSFVQLLAQSIDYDKLRSLADEGNDYECISMINEIIASSDEPLAHHYHLKTDYLLEFEAYKDALTTLDYAIKVMPDSVTLYTTRGSLYDAFRMYPEALKDFTDGYERVKNNDGQRANLLSNRGATKSKMRDFQGAYKDLKLATKLDDSNINAFNNLAAVCDEVNRKDETLVYLERIIAIDSTYIPAYVNLGFKYQVENDHEGAIVYFDKAVELDDKQPLAYSNRAYSRLKVNDIEGALEDINYSLELYPSNSYAYKIRALIYIEQKDENSACDDLRKALNLGYETEHGQDIHEIVDKYCKGVKN